MSNYLKLNFLDNALTLQKVNHHEVRNKPFADSDVFLGTIESFRVLTKGQDVKRVYNLKLSIKSMSFNFLPGDTIGILPRNNNTEVHKILNRLNIDKYKEEVYDLEMLQNTTKKNAALPKHIPKQGKVKDIFVYYVDIRKPPKKLFLKALIPYTKDTEEIKLLENICSPSGSQEYMNLITGRAQTLLGLLNTFPSCDPPLELILEHSLPLHPRYYSISSSPLQNDTLNITFFVVENDDGTKGVCTGWLEEVIKKVDMEPEKIPLYFRKPNNFRIPPDISTPMLMIATGTGIAPFVSFLDHRLLTMNENNDIGTAYLFYGCRYSDRDFLYKNELEGYLKSGVLTKMYTAFSRDTENKWYVQDVINGNGKEFVNNILCSKAILYVCGDTRTVVKGVKDVLIHNLVLHGHLDESTAANYLDEMIKTNRFVADCWT